MDMSYLCLDCGKDKIRCSCDKAAPFKVEKLEPFPPGSNPFHHDAFNMGTSIDDNIMIMYSQHKGNKSVIIVDMTTGERLRVSVPGHDSKR